MPRLNHADMVLITRPGSAGTELQQQLKTQGFDALLFPMIEIQPCSIEPLPQGFDAEVVIFVSPNAVRYALAKERSFCRNAKIAAVGKGTLACLADYGINVDIVPQQQFNSEGLLLHPDLQQVANKNILIVRGQGGREKLKNELEKRGANVRYLEVYLRLEIPYSAAQIRQIQQKPVKWVQVSNQQTLDLLLQKLRTADWFGKAKWLLLSKRSQQYALAQGLDIENCIVLTPGNEALLSYLKEQ